MAATAQAWASRSFAPSRSDTADERSRKGPASPSNSRVSEISQSRPVQGKRDEIPAHAFDEVPRRSHRRGSRGGDRRRSACRRSGRWPPYAVGDAQVVWDSGVLTVYDASSNTVYRLTLPSSSQSPSADNGQAPSVDEINSFLTKLGADADVSAATATNVAGRPAYSVRVSPKHDGGLLGYAELAWDAEHGVPLRLGIYAQGSSRPVLELAATDVSYGSVPASDVTVTPPAGVKTVDLSAPTSGAPDTSPAKPDFTVVAPDALVGLPRQDMRAVGHGG